MGLLPYAVKTVLGIVLFDLASYWGHRWSHEVPFLWRFHVIHHSSKRLDWVSGVRVHPLDGVVLAPAFVLLLAAGFSSRVTGAVLVAELVVGIFLHANVNWRLRPLHRVVATPEFHHWHHANEPDARNTNYAALLPVWDLIFGTYFLPDGRRPQVYGTDEAVPASVIAQLRYPYRGALDLRRIGRHPILALRVWRTDLRRGIGQLRARDPAPPTGLKLRTLPSMSRPRATGAVTPGGASSTSP